jgi:hypothetical protein
MTMLENPALGIVIPAQAGIQTINNAFPKAHRVDSRSPAFAEDKLRGDDDAWGRPGLASDTNTRHGENL